MFRERYRCPRDPGVETSAGQLHRRNRELSHPERHHTGIEPRGKSRASTAYRTGSGGCAPRHACQLGMAVKRQDGRILARRVTEPTVRAGCHPHLTEGSCYCLDTYPEGDLAGAVNINVVTCCRLDQLMDGTDELRYHASIPLYAASDKRLGDPKSREL